MACRPLSLLLASLALVLRRYRRRQEENKKQKRRFWARKIFTEERKERGEWENLWEQPTEIIQFFQSFPNFVNWASSSTRYINFFQLCELFGEQFLKIVPKFFYYFKLVQFLGYFFPSSLFYFFFFEIFFLFVIQTGIHLYKF